MSDTATVSPTPAAAPAATPATPAPATPAPATGTTEPQGSQAPAGAPAPAQAPGETAPAEDSFLADPKSLPPELKKHYDNMLRDYKKKTGEIADVRKKAEAFERLAKDEQVVDFLNRRARGEQTAQQQLEQAKKQMDVSDEDFNKALSSKEEFLKLMAKVARESNADLAKKLEKTEQVLQSKMAAETIDEFAEQGHQDIYDLENYGFISYQFRVDPNIKLEDAYQNAKQVHDDIYTKGLEAGKKAYQETLQKKVAASTEPPTASPAGSYSGGDPKKLTAAEALAWARKGVVVPQS